MGVTCWRRRRQLPLAFAGRLQCMLLVIALGWQHLSFARAIIQEGGGFVEHDNKLSGRFEQESLGNAEMVGDLEIFTRVGETAGHAHSELPDASLPHGREVRVSLNHIYLWLT